MTQPIKIKNHRIGLGWPAYIVAEMSANHNQGFDTAVKIIEAAKEAGADAIKIQTYTPDTITIDCDNENFIIAETLWKGRKLYDLYKEAYTPWAWQQDLMQVAKKNKINFFSTPFDITAVDFLEKINVPVYKIASFELVDLPLIRRVARTGKPLIMSTGMATLAEIEEAVQTARAEGNNKIILLKCTSAYPARPEDMNLTTIPHLGQAFGLPVGISDHTLSISVPVAAVTLGARVIEKHLTLSRDMPGPDNAFSLEPDEFREMVEAVRTSEKALGRVSYGPNRHEEKSKVFRKSLFVVKDMEKGEVFTETNVRSIRPGNGLHTRYLDTVLCKNARIRIKRGTPLSWDIIK